MSWVIDSFETDKHLFGGKRLVWVTYKHTKLSIYKIEKEVW